MEKNIAVIKGDGIGPEIVTESMKVLDKVAEKFGHKFNYTRYKKSARTVCKSSSLPALSGACRRLPLKDRDKRKGL